MRKYWKGKLCAIACLASISGENPYSVFKEVYDSGAGWDENVGWKHQNCIDFLKKSGFRARKSRFYFFRSLFRYGMTNWQYYLASVNVVSGSHLLIVTWFDSKNSTIYGFDPWENWKGAEFIMPYGEFLSKWRGYWISVSN